VQKKAVFPLAKLFHPVFLSLSSVFYFMLRVKYLIQSIALFPRENAGGFLPGKNPLLFAFHPFSKKIFRIKSTSCIMFPQEMLF
jgi:hypothetical protein